MSKLMNTSGSIGRSGIASRLRPGPRSGGALVLALIAVITVSILSAAYLQLNSSIMRRQGHSVDRKRAFSLAEAGLAEAHAGLAVGKTGNVGSRDAPATFGDGLFWVEATELDEGQVGLESTGMCGSGRACLSLVLERDELAVADLGFFSTVDLVIGEDSLVDGYDSAQGSYDSQVDETLDPPRATAGAKMGSDADIQLLGSRAGAAMVFGDATPGTSGVVTVGPGALVEGSTSPRPEAGELPPVEPPSVPMSVGGRHDGPLPLIIPPGDVGYEVITVGSDGEVIVQGPINLVVGDLILEPQATLTLDASDGQISVYVTQSLRADEQALLQSTVDDPARVAFYVSAEDAEVPTMGQGDPSNPSVQLETSTQFHGILYAPRAYVSLAGGFEVFGAVLAKGLQLEQGARLHFDVALASAACEGRLPKVLSWKIIELPESVPSGDLSNPFNAMGVERDELLPPDQAHQPTWVDIEYDDQDGQDANFSGWDSDFERRWARRVKWLKRDKYKDYKDKDKDKDKDDDEDEDD